LERKFRQPETELFDLSRDAGRRDSGAFRRRVRSNNSVAQCKKNVSEFDKKHSERHTRRSSFEKNHSAIFMGAAAGFHARAYCRMGSLPVRLAAVTDT